MNGMTTGFGLLSFITVLPLIGAVLALFAGKHARAVAFLRRLPAL